MTQVTRRTSPARRRRRIFTLALALVAAALVAFGCKDKEGSAAAGAQKPRIAYITNGVASFWVIAEKGVIAGGKQYDAEISVLLPSTIAEQQQKVEDLLVRGVDGIAISPIDGENQVPLLNQAAAKTKLITHDSDAPKSERLMYIGVDNYGAGRMAGKLLKEAIPAGGKVAIFVGRLEQDNARKRRQGIIDELLDRPLNSANFDPAGAELKGAKYSIVATLTDQFDRSKSKSNAEDMMSAHPDLAAMVGLFAYSTPDCLEALKRAGKLGKIKVVGFDEQDATLQAIKDGNCHGTVVQDPYMYGKESVRVLAALARGDRSVIPADKFIDVPARMIRKDGVDAFWDDLKKKTAKDP